MTQAKTVLVVDDDRTTRMAMTHLLDMEGYAVRAAENGAVALEMIAKERPALVLSDVRMPVMDGEALVAELKKRDGPPIVLMTAHDRVDDDSARALGAAGLVRKPIDIDDLFELLQRLL